MINIVIFIILYILFYFINYHISLEIPNVAFPFKNIYDNNGNKLNIILISAPFRTKKDMKKYNQLKKKGLYFCGISSYLEFPEKIINPYEDQYHVEKNHDYTKMVSSWIYCFRKVPPKLLNSNLPLLFLTEADLKDTDLYKFDPEIKKEYDFMYVCLQDNDTCEAGWQSFNRNWELAKKCLVIMCQKYKLKGILVGRTNCEFTDHCTGIVKVIPSLDFNDFQKEMQKCRFLFAPNIYDASPRVITEALCYNIPVLVNYNILGGWHNVIPNITGEFFTNEIDIDNSINKIINNNTYTPRQWYIENRGLKNSGAMLADFLLKNYPNINNKNITYASI